MDVLFDIWSMKQCSKYFNGILYNSKKSMQIGAKNVYEVWKDELNFRWKLQKILKMLLMV